MQFRVHADAEWTMPFSADCITSDSSLGLSEREIQSDRVGDQLSNYGVTLFSKQNYHRLRPVKHAFFDKQKKNVLPAKPSMLGFLTGSIFLSEEHS